VNSQKFDQLEANLLLSNFTIKDLLGGNQWKKSSVTGMMNIEQQLNQIPESFFNRSYLMIKIG
jgi:hypothetical protein